MQNKFTKIKISVHNLNSLVLFKEKIKFNDLLFVRKQEIKQ